MSEYLQGVNNSEGLIWVEGMSSGKVSKARLPL